MNPPIYLFSDKLNYKTFYSLWKKFPSIGVTPVVMQKGKIVWELIRDKKMYVYLDPLQFEDPVIFAYKLPKGRKVVLLENPKK